MQKLGCMMVLREVLTAAAAAAGKAELFCWAAAVAPRHLSFFVVTVDAARYTFYEKAGFEPTVGPGPLVGPRLGSSCPGVFVGCGLLRKKVAVNSSKRDGVAWHCCMITNQLYWLFMISVM